MYDRLTALGNNPIPATPDQWMEVLHRGLRAGESYSYPIPAGERMDWAVRRILSTWSAYPDQSDTFDTFANVISNVLDTIADAADGDATDLGRALEDWDGRVGEAARSASPIYTRAIRFFVADLGESPAEWAFDPDVDLDATLSMHAECWTDAFGSEVRGYVAAGLEEVLEEWSESRATLAALAGAHDAPGCTDVTAEVLDALELLSSLA